MLGKRDAREGAKDAVPQDLRGMVKAKLLEVQSNPIHGSIRRQRA